MTMLAIVVSVGTNDTHRGNRLRNDGGIHCSIARKSDSVARKVVNFGRTKRCSRLQLPS